METNQTKQSTNPCTCDCTVCRVGHHRALRIVFIILGLLIAFSLGAKLGELRGYMRGGYGDWGRDDRFFMMRGGWNGPMMQYYGTAPTNGQPAPATPAPAQQ